MRCFSHCWWDAALLSEKGWNLLMKLQHFPDRSGYVDIVWYTQWIWNTSCLTVCLIEDWLGINHTDDLKMHSKPSVSWRCSGCTACTQVVCAVDYVWNTWYVSNPCMDLRRLCPQVFSHDFWKSLTNIQDSSYVDTPPHTVFWEIWLYGYHVCYTMITCKETSTLLEVCILLLIVSYFYCILYMKLFKLKTFAKCMFAFFSDAVLAVILRTSVEFLRWLCEIKNYNS